MKTGFSLSYSPKTSSFKAMSSFMCFLMVFLSIAPTIQAAQYSQQRADAARLAMVENSGRVQLLDENEMKGVVGKADEETVGSETVTSSSTGDVPAAITSEPSPGVNMPSASQVTEGETSSGGSGNRNIMGGFNVDSYTGSATMRVPIDVPTGKSGMQPELTLVYNSSAGSSWCGQGWDLNPGYIIRLGANKGIPQYNSTDRYFYVINGSSTELVEGSTGEYRIRKGQSNLRFTWSGGTNLWQMYDKNGNRYYFGSRSDTDSKEWGHKAGVHVASKWFIDKAEDVDGNYMLFNYSTYTEVAGAGNINIYQILLNSIVYSYPNSKYRVSFEHTAVPSYFRLLLNKGLV